MSINSPTWSVQVISFDCSLFHLCFVLAHGRKCILAYATRFSTTVRLTIRGSVRHDFDHVTNYLCPRIFGNIKTKSVSRWALLTLQLDWKLYSLLRAHAVHSIKILFFYVEKTMVPIILCGCTCCVFSSIFATTVFYGKAHVTLDIRTTSREMLYIAHIIVKLLSQIPMQPYQNLCYLLK